MTTEPPEPLDAFGAVPVCATCNSERVMQPASSIWNADAGRWELEETLERPFCRVCDTVTVLIWTRPDQPPMEAIRTLNDAWRCLGIGNGQLLVTSGVQDKGGAFVVAAVNAMRTFDDFSSDNDVYGEHDFGAFHLDGERLFFKIDYYDRSLSAGSENPANPEKTVRVLTLMLAKEY